MSGIMASLKPRHDISAIRKPIYNFSFAFITPWRADNHNISHNISYQIKGADIDRACQ